MLHFPNFRFSRAFVLLIVAVVLAFAWAISPSPVHLPVSDRLLFLAALAVMAGYWVDRSLARHVGAYRLRPDRVRLQLLYTLIAVTALMFLVHLWT